MHAYPVEGVSTLSLTSPCSVRAGALASPTALSSYIVSFSPNGYVSSVGCGLIPAQIGCKEFRDIRR